MNYVNDKFQRSFEIVAERFLSKIGFGELIVTFPSGLTKSFKGTNGDEIADLKLHNYKFISKILKRKSIGFAESYMRDEFETDNLSNLIEITARNIKIIYKFYQDNFLKTFYFLLIFSKKYFLKM